MHLEKPLDIARIAYLREELRAIAKGGIPVLLRKSLVLLQLVAAVLIVLLVRVLRPVILIRFRPLSNRIGQFVGSTELYLCQRDLGMHAGRTLDRFYFAQKIPNGFVKKKWQKKLHIYFFAYPLDWINRWLPGGNRHVVPMPEIRDIDRVMERTSVHFTFTAKEEDDGWNALGNLGAPYGAPFVCFQARDPAYLDSFSSEPGRFGNHYYRDSTIHNYVPAVEQLALRGYFAIRMGAIVREPLKTSHPMIIDYAATARTEFLDIFLSAKCSFYLMDTVGMCAVTLAFRRPVAFVNYVPLENFHTWRPEVLSIPKKHWLRKEQRFMTFREVIDSGAGRFMATDDFERLGIDLLENTPEEITAVAVEMEARLNGTWQTTPEHEELQRRFWSLFKPSLASPFNHKIFLSRIGAEFLRQNRALLD